MAACVVRVCTLAAATAAVASDDEATPLQKAATHAATFLSRRAAGHDRWAGSGCGAAER